MLGNIKIGIRLIAAFLIVAAASAIVGYVGISNAGKINDMADRMYERELLGLSYVKEANINLIYIGRARANALLASSQEDRAKQMAIADKAIVTLKEQMEKARPLFVSERGKIRSRRITGLSRRQQSLVSAAVKRARTMGLLPYPDQDRKVR